MIFIITTLFIAVLCLFGLIRTLKDKNILGIGFSLISLLIFGWFGVMSTIALIKDALAS